MSKIAGRKRSLDTALRSGRSLTVSKTCRQTT